MSERKLRNGRIYFIQVRFNDKRKDVSKQMCEMKNSRARIDGKVSRELKPNSSIELASPKAS